MFVSFLGISFVIGAVAARSIKNTSDYFVAGARMPWFFLTGTFVASNVSAGLFLGATNMTGRHGYTIWCAYFTTSIGFFLAIAVIGVLVRRLASHYEIYDFADILATRYNSRPSGIRTVTTLILPIVYIPMLAAQFIALATIAGGIMGLPYHTVLTAIAVLVIAYTILGGMLGVVWTDGFQFIVLFLGLILAVPIAMKTVGGGDVAQGWTQLVNVSPDIFKWSTDDWPWFIVLGQFTWAFAAPIQPHLVTRFLTAKDEKQILIALPVCMTVGLIIYASTVPLGLLGRVATPELAEGGYYYMELARSQLGPWLGAFALAGIAAAALSTCSTALIVTGQQLIPGGVSKVVGTRGRRQARAHGGEGRNTNYWNNHLRHSVLRMVRYLLARVVIRLIVSFGVFCTHFRWLFLPVSKCDGGFGIHDRRRVHGINCVCYQQNLGNSLLHQ